MLLLGRTSVNLNVLPAADLGPTEPESYHNPWCTARWSSVLRRSSRCCAEPSKQRQLPSKGRACSVLWLGKAVGQETVEAEGVDVDRLAHVADPAGAQDVE